MQDTSVAVQYFGLVDVYNFFKRKRKELKRMQTEANVEKLRREVYKALAELTEEQLLYVLEHFHEIYE